MYSYDEYVGLIDEIKKKYFQCRDNYEDLWVNTNSMITNSLRIRSRKSIHNIDACPRPNLASIVKEFEFADEGAFWAGKNQYSYTCGLNKSGKVVMTAVGINQFIEINIIEENDTFLLGFENTETGHELKSVGLVRYKGNKPVSFSVMEILKMNTFGVEFVLNTEEYGYDEDGKLLNILLYHYCSDAEITVFDKSADLKQLWYTELVSGEITSNPTIHMRKFIYENDVLKRATSKDLYNSKAKVFVHKVIG